MSAGGGSWASPISAQVVASAGIGVSAVMAGETFVCWTESRPDEAGRMVIVRRAPDGRRLDLLPPGFSARTRVHEYGGGASLMVGESVVFSNWEDQRLWRVDEGVAPYPLTPPTSVPAGSRFADGRASPDARWLFSVHELHPTESAPASDVQNELVVLPASGGEPRVVASGHDFYAAPRPSPDGSRLAWLTWDHPRMPWDGTDLWTAPVEADGTLGPPEHVAGGPDESVLQPQWDGTGALWYVSDRTGWWNLYREGSTRPVVSREAEFGVPPWVFGTATYAPLPSGEVVCSWIEGGKARLGLLDPTSGDLRPLELPYTAYESMAVQGDRVVMVAASPTANPAVVAIEPRDGAVELLRDPEPSGVDESYISVPVPVEFSTSTGERSHAFHYLPANPGYRLTPGEAAPLLVVSHGGPTSAARPTLNLAIQYWTSRGFAVVDVDYGGSTGYGRAYRQRLEGNWGLVDVEDCIAAARHLVAEGHADASRIGIRGGSAGGFTTLRALTTSDLFAVGASYYGVADLEALALDTHKFESRYLDSLVGPYPAARDVYVERSPIYGLAGLSCPIILLQGLDDQIVPPSQADSMAAALRAKGIPFVHLGFEGEQHGFRRAETIIAALEAELSFYGQILGFEPAGGIPVVAVQR